MKSIYKTVSGGDRVSNKELRSAGFIMCTYCTNGTNIRDFIEYFDLPDTYFSWFLVTELHIWMISNVIRVLIEIIIFCHQKFFVLYSAL